MKKIIFIALLAIASSGFATDLLQIYQESLNCDPVFKQAYTTYMANREAVPQAWSALLPQILGTGFIARVRQTPIQPDPITLDNRTFSLVPPAVTYDSNQWSVTLSQAVFNYQAWSQVSQAKSSVRQAQATFNAAAQNLILRVAQAYFNVLQAEDTLRFTKAENRANKRQLDQATQRYKVGLEAITSMYEAQAAYDTTAAQVITDENNVKNQYENLRRLTNQTYTSLAPLRDAKLPLIKPAPENVQRWVDTALQQNYNFAAARFSMEAARQNIATKASGALPTVTFQANHTANANSDDKLVVPPTFAGTNDSVQLALNFPAFQGGLVLSQTRQAKYNFETAAQFLEQSYRDTVVNTRISYNNVIDGLSKVKADRIAVMSAANSAESTEAQYEVGTRTMVDVLLEQQKLFQSQTTLAIDQYTYINAILNLKYAAGTLSAQDIMEINAWLASDSPTLCPTKKAPVTKQKLSKKSAHEK